MIDVRLHEHPDSADTFCCAEVTVDGSFQGRLVLYTGAVVVYRWHDVGPHLSLEAMQPAYHLIEQYEAEHGLSTEPTDAN